MMMRKIYMECPLCDKVHEVEERRRSTTLVVKGLEVEYEETYYYCCNSKEFENEFETGKMSNANLLNARNSYRKKMGYLTSHEIVDIREKYGLSQVELAKLLGWGEATISRYESKAIQDEAYDNMLRIIKENPMIALEYLEKNKDSFSTSKIELIRENIAKELESHGKEFLARQSLKSEYVIYEEPSEVNGYMVLNIDKVESVISYYAEKIENLHKAKMMKLLWYADSLAYKKYGRSITGLVYLHNKMGTSPVGQNQLLTLDNVNVKEEENLQGTTYLFMKHKDVDQTCLSEDELIILDRVVDKFKTYDVEEIASYMHEETAYKNTNNGDIIPFGLAKEIRSF